MLDLNELWIGDLVLLRKSKRIGKFEGVKDGKAVINVSGKKVVTTATNLQLANLDDVPDKSDSSTTENKVSNVDMTEPRQELDLHIEVLNPSMQHGRPERILAIQVTAAERFIQSAIEHKLPSVKIIHGKGKGVLRAEIYHLISIEPAILTSYVINNGGGVELLFR